MNLGRYYELAHRMKMPVVSEGGRSCVSLKFRYPYDDWTMRESGGQITVTRIDKLVEDARLRQERVEYPVGVLPEEVLKQIIKVSRGLGRVYDTGQYIDNMVRRVWVSCKRYHFKMEYRYGEIHISTKFDKWFFIPKYGKIKLMHYNTRYNRGGDYHLQYNKEVPVEEIVHYIYKHTRSMYYTAKRIKQ